LQTGRPEIIRAVTVENPPSPPEAARGRAPSAMRLSIHD
jgi:hypothetical protein